MIKPLISLATVLALAAPLCLAQQPERKEGRPREEKKYHRELMTQIVKGGAEKAAAELEADAVRNPGDPETDFCLAAAYAKLGDRAKAVAHAKAAVARGLDAGRFVAGPRAIFAPLAEDPEFVHLRQQVLEFLYAKHGHPAGTQAGNQAETAAVSPAGTRLAAVAKSDAAVDSPKPGAPGTAAA